MDMMSPPPSLSRFSPPPFPARVFSRSPPPRSQSRHTSSESRLQFRRKGGTEGGKRGGKEREGRESPLFLPIFQPAFLLLGAKLEGKKKRERKEGEKDAGEIDMRWEFLPAQPPFKGACFEKRAFRKKEEGLLRKACGTYGSKHSLHLFN